MNFSVTNNRLKLNNGYDVSGSINTSSLLVGTSVGINPTNTLDVSGNADIRGNLSVYTNVFFVDSSNNRVGIGTSTPSYPLDVSGSVKITSITDDSNNIGLSGQLLSSTGSSINWINQSAISAGTVSVTLDTTDTTCFIPFTNAVASGTAQALKGNSSLTYNASTNEISVPRIKPAAIVDPGNSVGALGQLLSSTGSTIDWINQSAIAAGTVSVALDTTDTACFIPFTNAVASGTAQELKGNSSLIYNASTNELGVPRAKPTTIIDNAGSNGASGQVLSSTSTALSWIDQTSIGAGSVAVANEVADTTCFPLFVNNTPSGSTQLVKANNALTYNSATAELGVSKIRPITIIDGSASAGTSGQILSSTTTGISWISAGKSAIYVYNTTSFTPTLDNTAQKFPLNTSITSVYNNGFSITFTNDRITYTGSSTATFLIEAHILTGGSSSGPISFGVELRKNGSVIPGASASSESRFMAGTASLPYTSYIVCSGVTSLTNTNYIEIFCTCSNIGSVSPAAFAGYTPTGLTTNVPTVKVYITQIS